MDKSISMCVCVYERETHNTTHTYITYCIHLRYIHRYDKYHLYI